MPIEPNLYETLRSQVAQLRTDFEALKLQVNGNPFLRFAGVMGRLDGIEQTVTALQQQHYAEEAQQKQERRDWKVWRIGLTISLGFTLVVLGVLVAIVLGSAHP